MDKRAQTYIRNSLQIRTLLPSILGIISIALICSLLSVIFYRDWVSDAEDYLNNRQLKQVLLLSEAKAQAIGSGIQAVRSI